MGKPTIRFKGYTDDWEQRKLGDIYGSIGNAFVGTATPYYAEQGHFYLESNNVKDGQINHNSEIFINDEFYEKQKDKWLHTGDMVMVQSGHVGHAAVIPEELDNTAAHALIMFRNPKEEIEPYFLNYEYQTDKTKRKIENITTGNTIKHILASDMQEFIVDVPKYEEQKEIAGYFCSLDYLITLHQCKCDQAKILKKYMLQKMFPQNDEKVPKIRFKSFTDDWELRKVTELLKNSSSAMKIGPFGSALKKEYFVEEGIKVYAQENAFTGDFSMGDYYITEDKYKELKSCELYPGDLVISMMGTIGACAIFPKNAEKGIMNSHLLRLQFNNEVIPEYIMYLLRDSVLIRKQIDRLSVGSIMSGLSSSVVKKLVFPISKLAEQKRIVEYLDSIDHLITLHQHKCEELKNIKKFMLQNMFVQEK